MKRIFIVLLIALLVLTSCSTGKATQEEPEIEVVTATPEKAPTADVPVVEPSVQPEEPKEAEAPVVETELPQEPEVVIEVLPDEEVIVVDEPQPIDEKTAEEIIEALVEQDWSQVITATAPAEEKPAAEQKPAETAKPAATAEKPAAEADKPAATQTTPATQAPAAAQTVKKAAEKAESGIAAFFSKVGSFIMKEKLLSIGLLVCAIGVIYLIVALVISKRPRKHKHHRHDSEQYYQEAEEDAGEDEDAGYAAPEEDVRPGEDDEFLRSLLGDDKK